MIPKRRCSVAAALCSCPRGSYRPQSCANPAAGANHRNSAQSGKRVDPLHDQVQEASSPGAEPGPRRRDLDCFAGDPPVENEGKSRNEWTRLRRESQMDEFPESANWGESSIRPGGRVGGSRQDPRRSIYGGWQARDTRPQGAALSKGLVWRARHRPRMSMRGGKFRTRKDWFQVLTVPLLDEAESIASVSLGSLRSGTSKRFPYVDVCADNARKVLATRKSRRLTERWFRWRRRSCSFN